jgi:hypothetical protein
MPEQVAEAIVRLEERNLQADEQLAVAQHRSIALQEQMVELQTATLAAQQAMAQAMERIADRLDALTLARPVSDTTTVPKQPTTETVLADWRERLSVTEDVWTVAVVIAPVLVEKGELRQPLEAIAARTGLSVHRVNECLRLLRKHACIHPMGAAEDGAPVYVLNRRARQTRRGRPQDEFAAGPFPVSLLSRTPHAHVISLFGCSRIAATSASTLEPSSPSTSRWSKESASVVT